MYHLYDDLEVILLKQEQLSTYAPPQHKLVHQVFQCGTIGIHLKVPTKQIVAVLLEHVYHSQSFALSSKIVLFSFGQPLACEHDWVIDAFCTFLRKYSA